MMRILLLALAALALAACEPTEEQRARVVRDLPRGCTLLDLGRYGEFESLVVVICKGQGTTTTNLSWSQQCGKIRCHHAAATTVVAD